MRYVLWVVLPLLFLFFISLAVKNLDPVAVRYFLGHEWRAPLIFVLFMFFVVGAVLGVLAAFGIIVRQRREMSALRRELLGRAEPAREPLPPDVVGQ
jgi:putative membrane protein